MNEKRKGDPLFVGLTRPAMIFGVTLDVLLFNLIITSVVFIATQNLLYFALAIPVHGAAALICLNEPRTFNLLFSYVSTRNMRNKAFWKSSSYQAMDRTEYEKAKN